MATKKSSDFTFEIVSETIAKQIKYAAAKVVAQNRESKGKVHGAIFAQILVVADKENTVKIRGDYIEPEYCDALQAVLNKRARERGR